MKIPQVLIPIIFAVIVTGISAIVALFANWFGADNPQAWFFFTILIFFGSMISYVWLRQIYWWLVGKGDYEGKGLPKLFRKNE